MYRFFPPPGPPGPRWSSRRGPEEDGRGLYGVLIGCYLLGIRIVFFSERDIVVLRFGRRSRRCGCGRLGRRAARSAEELDVVGHDLDLAPLHAVGLPTALPQASLDQHGPPLGKVLGAIPVSYTHLTLPTIYSV